MRNFVCFAFTFDRLYSEHKESPRNSIFPRKGKQDLDELLQRYLQGNQVPLVYFTNEALTGVPGSLRILLTARSLIRAKSENLRSFSTRGLGAEVLGVQVGEQRGRMSLPLGVSLLPLGPEWRLPCLDNDSNENGT